MKMKVGSSCLLAVCAGGSVVGPLLPNSDARSFIGEWLFRAVTDGCFRTADNRTIVNMYKKARKKA